MINISQNILVMKIEDVKKIALEIKGSKMKINFQFFKWSFVRNGWPYGLDFWRVFRDHCEASKMYNFTFFFQNIAKVITY